MVWTGLVHGLSGVATDFAERRDATFKGEFVAKYVPESTVSVETGRRKAGAEKSLLIPSTIAIGTLEIPTVRVPKGSRKMLKLRCDPKFFSTCRDMLRKPGKVQDVSEC